MGWRPVKTHHLRLLVNNEKLQILAATWELLDQPTFDPQTFEVAEETLQQWQNLSGVYVSEVAGGVEALFRAGICLQDGTVSTEAEQFLKSVVLGAMNKRPQKKRPAG